MRCSGPALAKAILVWAEKFTDGRSNSVKQAAVVYLGCDFREWSVLKCMSHCYTRMLDFSL